MNEMMRKCRNCGRKRAFHKAVTFHCPFGLRTRVGWTSFHSEMRFAPVETKAEREERERKSIAPPPPSEGDG